MAVLPKDFIGKQVVMKILFLADPNSIHDVKWISYFTSRNKVEAFLLPRRQHWPNPDLQIPGIEVETLDPIEDFSMVRFPRTITTAIYIRKMVVRHKIDLINIHYAEPNALWCLFRWYLRVPMIITTLGTDVLITIPKSFERKTLLNYVVAPAYKRAFRNADWITSTSKTQVDSVKEFSGRKGEFDIIRTGVDTERLLSDTSAFFPLQDNSAYVLFPRSIKPIYNHEFSLKAISLLPEAIKANYTMVFLGRNEGDMNYQKELEHPMRGQKDVKFVFLGKQSQKAIFELYKRAGAVVMCPISDGSPVSGMETLLCGTKLILGPPNYDTDVFSQAIRMRTWDANELATLITQALDDPGRPQLSAETIAAMDRETNMQKMMHIYESLIEAKDM